MPKVHHPKVRVPFKVIVGGVKIFQNWCVIQVWDIGKQ